ncbi:S-layer homology domain-containing protein, partial [Collinsella ihumii]
KHTKKVAAVVTASLVGALSLGVAPVAAVADTGIETLAAEWHTGAKVTAAEDGKGAVFTGDLTKPVSFDLGSGKYLVPTEVTNQNGDKTDVIDNELSVEYTMPLTGAAASDGTWDGLVSGGRYKIDGKGAVVTLSNPVSADFAASYFGGTLTDENGKEVRPVAGTYTVIVGGKVTMNFKLADENPYAGTYAYTGTDSYNKEIVYNGGAQDIRFAKADGTPLSYDASGSKDYSAIDWYKSDGSAIASITDAGSYTAVLKNNGVEVAKVNFTVEKFDISKHGGVVADYFNNALGTGSAATSNFLTAVAGSLSGNYTIADVTAPSGVKGFDGSFGEYTVTVKATSNTSNVTGEATFKFSNLNTDIFSTLDLYYGASPVSGTTININLTEGESFDASKIKVRKADGSSVYAGDQLEVTYKQGSKTVDASALAKAGTYTVTVRVKPFQDADGNWVGGTDSFKVKVNGNQAYDTNVSFYLDGELADASESIDYSGADQLERVTAKVANPEGGSFEYGTDFTLEVKKDGKVVDSIVDAGEYEVTIKPVTFEFASTVNKADYTFTLTVNPLTVNDLKPYYYNGDDVDAAGEDSNGDFGNRGVSYVNDGVAWTGSAVEVPALAYKNADGDYVELDSSLYNVVSIKKGTKTVKEAVDEGIYTVTVALSDAAGSNYSLKARTFEFEVVKYNPFDDVESPAWYASVVADAKYTNVVNGISGTNLYAPEADITRADAICILFNLAGGDNAMGDYQYSETTGWITGFDDVDGHAYYAKALAWAHSTGVANGYAGTTSFRPEAKITREEFASLLANFAKVSGKDVDAADGALDGMSDANTVSDWAEANVAWAVEAGIMGNGGFVAGQSNISRAEVAAMAMNYRSM